MIDEKIKYFWGPWKNPSFRGGFQEKPIYWGVCLRMRELGQFADLRVDEGRGLGKKEGVVFLRRGLTPQCTLREC